MVENVCCLNMKPKKLSRNEEVVKQPVHLPSLTEMYTKEAVG